MFFQVAVPSDDSRCLQFLWREDPEQRVEVYEYTRRVFGAKSLTTCSNYALHQVAKDEESLVEAVQRNYYIDDFHKSVRTPHEAVEIYQKVRILLSKSGLNFTKWIMSDDELKSQIPEADKSKRQSWSVFGLIWNVKMDSLIVCRGTEREFPAKITRELSYRLSQQCSTQLGYVHP